MLKRPASREGWLGESPVLAERARSEGPRWTRAVEDQPGHPLKASDKMLRPWLRNGASLGKEAALAASGRAGEVDARVGRVRTLAFLSNLLTYRRPIDNTFIP
jgi:hypothetical protein